MINTSCTRKWDPGMDLPRGAPPRIRMRQEDLRQCPRDGEGTLENPLVIWVARLTDEQRDELAVPEFEHEADLYRAVDANTDIAKTVAVRSGCTVVWIICPVHEKKYAHDENGDKIPTMWDEEGNPIEYLVVDADPHITIRLGTSENLCVLHGHINVLVDERGFPTTFMTSFQRQRHGHITDGDDRTFELFEWFEKGSSTERRLQQEAADYELFRTITVNCEEWEIEDAGKSDPDYIPPDHIELLNENSVEHVPDCSNEVPGLDAEFEDYIINKWSPYRGERSMPNKNFGYSARRLRYPPVPSRSSYNTWNNHRRQPSIGYAY
ncbi:hypothetical protein GGS26DRAFT_601594 [Hypomontagnella submonticulosa]|nr:hypothetical protein GGS26DRAFT_601594 [Hypomontagnella submonticulosa]